jgi:hypothetical protein
VVGGLGALLMRNLSNGHRNGDSPEPQATLPLEEDGRGS